MSQPSPDPRPTPPPGWPAAERPVRVAILGWAWLSLQAREGSGYNLNASDLAAGLALSGHEVSYLRAGMDYSLRRSMYCKPIETWRGVSCWHLYNSPNLSPASSNFRNMNAEMSSPELARVVLGWLDDRRAEIVHIHSLEGFGLDLIPAIRASGRPVVVTAHNHWYVCPQVDLLRGEREVCTDYRGGEACVGCIDAPRPHRRRLLRSVQADAYRYLGGFWPNLAIGVAHHVRGAARRLLKPHARKPGVWWTANDRYPDADLALGFDATHTPPPEPAPPQTSRQTAPPAAWDTNERFLSGTHHLTILNDYGRRRSAGIDALNHASLVTPPSRFVLETLHTMGLRRDLGRHVLLGQPHFDRLHRAAKTSPYYTKAPGEGAPDRPIRFGFLGTARPNKGLEVLLRAITLLEPAVRARCHFMIRAQGVGADAKQRMSIYPEVSLSGGYETSDLVGLMREFDVGILPHIWFENSPLVLLEMLHAGKFVIAARLGGPPEWIVEPGTSRAAPLGNGLLFPGNDPEALAERIRRVAMGDARIPSPAEVHGASPSLRSYPDHVREVEAIYLGLLAAPPPALPSGSHAPVSAAGMLPVR